MKPVTWIGNSKKAIQTFSVVARKQAGYQLFRVQNNLEPNDWKPMPNIGKGVKEIRIHNPFEHRVIYVAKFQERVYVLHGFSKKTQKTSKRDLNLAKLAYRDMLERKKMKNNIFKELGFSDPESANLETRAQLLILLEKEIKKLKLSQAKVAKLLQVKPPRISEIMKGRIEKFSVDLLIVYLARLGKEVRFKVSSKAA